MSVTYSAYSTGSVDNFYHLPGTDDFSPLGFVVSQASTQSRMLLDAPHLGRTVTAELIGNFPGVFPAGTSITSIMDDPSGATLSQSKTYVNGILFNEEVYSTPIEAADSFYSTFDASSTLFGKIYIGNDTFIGSEFSRDDKVNGYGGNDLFYGYGDRGSDLFDGGSGIDTAIYRGALVNYAIVEAGGFWNPVTDRDELSGIKVTDSTLLDGVDQLVNVERLAFTDTMLALDTAANENAGNSYLLYQAAFDRAPDVEGLGYWISKVDGGANIVRDVAQNFILSSEFKSLYGANPSVPEFMGLLYQNVLNRTPDAEGLQYWLDEFAQAGDSTLYRAGLLNNFAISAENIANVADQIVDGIQYQAYVG